MDRSQDKIAKQIASDIYDTIRWMDECPLLEAENVDEVIIETLDEMIESLREELKRNGHEILFERVRELDEDDKHYLKYDAKYWEELARDIEAAP